MQLLLPVLLSDAIQLVTLLPVQSLHCNTAIFRCNTAATSAIGPTHPLLLPLQCSYSAIACATSAMHLHLPVLLSDAIQLPCYYFYYIESRATFNATLLPMQQYFQWNKQTYESRSFLRMLWRVWLQTWFAASRQMKCIQYMILWFSLEYEARQRLRWCDLCDQICDRTW